MLGTAPVRELVSRLSDRSSLLVVTAQPEPRGGKNWPKRAAAVHKKRIRARHEERSLHSEPISSIPADSEHAHHLKLGSQRKRAPPASAPSAFVRYIRSCPRSSIPRSTASPHAITLGPIESQQSLVLVARRSARQLSSPSDCSAHREPYARAAAQAELDRGHPSGGRTIPERTFDPQKNE